MTKAHGDGEAPCFKCSYCRYESESKWNLGQHLQKHTGELAFPCENVDSKLAQKPIWLFMSGWSMVLVPARNFHVTSVTIRLPEIIT